MKKIRDVFDSFIFHFFIEMNESQKIEPEPRFIFLKLWNCQFHSKFYNFDVYNFYSRIIDFTQVAFVFFNYLFIFYVKKWMDN
jgi:hypothetical protein